MILAQLEFLELHLAILRLLHALHEPLTESLSAHTMSFMSLIRFQ
jgi:hypothetical protein